MNPTGFSPEEILRKKELDGGIEFDPIMPDSNDSKVPSIDQPPVTNENPVLIDPIQEKVAQEPSLKTINPKYDQNLVYDAPQSKQSPNPESLGKAQRIKALPEDPMGWKNIPLHLVPSKGMFYPDGTRIAIRPAEVKEIRFYSTIDDDDNLDIEEKLSYVIERCCRIEFPNDGLVSYKDLKQEDRFFIILAIRDLTFVKGENMILLKPYKKCKSTPECPFEHGIELRTGVLSSYEIDPQILKYYNPVTRSFVFESNKISKKIEITIPSIGVTQEISKFIIEASKKGVDVDDGFISIAPFIFKNWQDLSYQTILGKMREIDNFWTKEEYSLYFELSERIKIGTKLEVKLECPVCGEKEVTANITFPRGLRSLFVISDIFRELL